MTMLGTPVASLIENEMLRVEGDAAELAGFIAMLDRFDYWFDVVTP
jgi:alkyl sulfatase BDS1-like metallo-beta-lactamase superfamily hydrolase